MNYLFYDYETSGTCERFDQVFQFAAIRTNENLDQVDEPLNVYCKLRTDILPSPHAIKVNEIDVSELNSKGLCEFEFAQRVCEALVGNGDQCVVGYNSKEFDNNFTRFLFYRNFLDPYAWSWANGNTCLDILDILRLGYSFGRLEELYLNDGNGPDSLRLEDLARWNGLVHTDSHDALSDVEATIQLARLIKDRCPRLFDYVKGLRSFDGVKKVWGGGQMFFHSRAHNGFERKFVSLELPICEHPLFDRSTIVWDLNCDPTKLLEYPAGEIRDQMYSTKENRLLDVGFLEVKLNKSPMIVRYSEKEKIRISNLAACEQNLEKVRNNLDKLAALAKEVFVSTIPEIDPDADLYAGDYFTEVEHDREHFDAVRKNPLDYATSSFRSLRFKRLLRRLKARNFFDDISEHERSKYTAFCAEKFAHTGEGKWMTRTVFDREYDEAIAEPDLSDEQRKCLAVLKNHADTIIH